MEQKVKKIISEIFKTDINIIHYNTCLTEDLNGDSLDIVELVIELEKEFDISIPDDKIEKLVTVKALLDYINSKTNQYLI